MSTLLARTEFPEIDGILTLVRHTSSQYFVSLDQPNDDMVMQFDNLLDAVTCFVAISTEVFHFGERIVSPAEIFSRAFVSDLDYSSYIIELSDVPTSVLKLFD